LAVKKWARETEDAKMAVKKVDHLPGKSGAREKQMAEQEEEEKREGGLVSFDRSRLFSSTFTAPVEQTKNILLVAAVGRARSIWEQILFVRTGRVSEDQAFNRGMDFHNLMIGSSWKATKLARSNDHTLPFDLNNNSPLKHQKTFVTF
jgi:hypothetical protein